LLEGAEMHVHFYLLEVLKGFKLEIEILRWFENL